MHGRGEEAAMIGNSFIRRIAAAAASGVFSLTLFGICTAGASAQVYGGYGGGYGDHDRDRDAVQGVVTSFDRFNLYVQTGYGNRYIHLHQGTVINPTGTTLRNGMTVQVRGYRDGNGTFEASEIDVTGWGDHHHWHDGNGYDHR
jgi:hypothetical protein